LVAQPGTAINITPPTAAFVALADAPPVGNDSSTNLGIGGSKAIQLSTTDTDATPTTSCTLVPLSISDPRLAVTIDNSPNICTAHLTDSGVGPQTVTFQFTGNDANSSGTVAGTVTVTIGTPSVDEPLSQVVNAGQLVLSCNSPETYLAPPAGSGTGNPALLCGTVNLPAITLNGLHQVTTGGGSTLYVSDNRGDPDAPWTLTAQMVATQIGAGAGQNPNTSCTGIVAFCNSTQGSHALDASGNGQIAKSRLSIGGISCAAHAGNLNPAATAGAGGTFAATQTICNAVATQAGGTFDVQKTYSLDIPSSVYSGTYIGTVEYTVA
jgi:hypothetical protein